MFNQDLIKPSFSPEYFVSITERLGSLSNVLHKGEKMSVAQYANSAIDSVKKFWTDLDIKSWAERIGGSSAEAVEAAIYFGLSFGAGFLFKKYFKLLFICLVVALFMIKSMEYAKFLVIDWTAVKSFFGITGGSDFNTLTNRCFDWIKEHLLLFIASTIGFLVGYKLG